MTLVGQEPVTTAKYFPAAEVAHGKITLEQAHQRYRGMVLLCPHCLHDWVRRQHSVKIAEDLLGQSSLYTAADWARVGLAERLGLSDGAAAGVGAFPADLRVKFRQAALSENKSVEKWMHFYHTVHRQDRTTKPPCYEPACFDHTVAIGAIQLMLEEEYKSQPGVLVDKEHDLQLSPSASKTKRRPDLLVKRYGQVERLLEVQRSVISNREFEERTKHLLTLCPRVEWYFFKSAYNQMGPQRRWLTEQGLIYYCIVRDGYKIRLEEGSPPKVRNTNTTSTKATSTCTYHDPNDPQPWRRQGAAPDVLLPLSVVGPAVYGQRRTSQQQSAAKPAPQFSLWDCSVGDRVEVYFEGKWRQGLVKSYNVENVPFIQFDQPVRRQRTMTPTNPKLLRRLSNR